MRGEVPPPRRAGSLTPALLAILVPHPDQRPTFEQVDWLLSQAMTTPTPYPGGLPPLHQAPTAISAPHRLTGKPPEHSLPLSPSVPSHPLSYGGHSNPSGHSATPLYAQPTATSRGVAIDAAAHSNRGVIVAAIIGVVVVVAAGVLAAVALRPGSSTNTPSTQAIPSLPVGTNIVQPSFTFPTTQPRTTSAGVDLLTPTGVRQAIAALEKATGGQNFTESTIYPEFITTGAPVKDRPTVYDEYTFRDGAATRTGPGGQISGHSTVALGGIDWDILPALLATAQDKLAVPNPKSHYIIIDPAWTFNDNKPTLLVYYSDEYNGGGYVAADVDGTLVRVYNSK
ncbi:hypothetical protein [Nocardia acidivorans]|uniref:hypothetical protein n=1 Tax=Nocardia acidivorans TaxID=404580 RepID=UPI00082BD586|nr:hypothetical protein [Nocardia acidivorans]